jgi:hypothetical protein
MPAPQPQTCPQQLKHGVVVVPVAQGRGCMVCRRRKKFYNLMSHINHAAIEPARRPHSSANSCRTRNHADVHGPPSMLEALHQLQN